MLPQVNCFLCHNLFHQQGKHKTVNGVSMVVSGCLVDVCDGDAAQGETCLTTAEKDVSATPNIKITVCKSSPNLKKQRSTTITYIGETLEYCISIIISCNQLLTLHKNI